ncbi:MAG: hypothetical protein ACI9NT_000975 [Bacteroidia bacterium]|jgi:hypothetical protein
MKGLAEFVMRGRLQALFATVFTCGSIVFCWIGAAVVALVTLRKGVVEGGWLLLWAVLPAGTVAYVYGDSSPLALLLGTAVLALVLRSTISLSLTVLASVALAGLIGLATIVFAGAYLDQMVAAFDQFLGNFEQQYLQGDQAVTLPRPEPLQIAGMLGVGTAAMSVLCLLLARYWQAALYNPGGFGVEFRALRYPIAVSLGLVVLGLAVSSLGLEYRTWAMMFFIPLSFAGLSLVHARASVRGQGTGWLIVFYMAWLVFDPVKLVVVLFAIADSWLDFRQRWGEVPPGTPPNDSTDSEDSDAEDTDKQNRQ